MITVWEPPLLPIPVLGSAGQVSPLCHCHRQLLQRQCGGGCTGRKRGCHCAKMNTLLFNFMSHKPQSQAWSLHTGRDNNAQPQPAGTGDTTLLAVTPSPGRAESPSCVFPGSNLGTNGTWMQFSHSHINSHWIGRIIFSGNCRRILGKRQEQPWIQHNQKHLEKAALGC